MSITDIPTDFGAASFMRVLLPGFLFVILISYTFFPLSATISGIFLSNDITVMLLFWIVSGFVIGTIISSKDFYIYNILNGYKCVPLFIKEFFNYEEINDYNQVKNSLTSLNEEKERLEPNYNDPDCKYRLACIEDEILKLSKKLRNYPFDKDGDPKFFYPATWTRLGNVIEEYERYSQICYGMTFDVFWYRLWYILSTDEQDDVGQRGAKADFLSYMAFLFLLYSLIAGFGIYPQLKNYIFPGNEGNTILAFFDVWLGSFLILYLIHRIFYNAAIDAHENYGGYIKALFDLHHEDLYGKIKPSTSDEIEKCEELSSNFEDYTQFQS